MTVYVDKLFKYKNKQWCHMWADDEEELHSFALILGLKREWAQFHQGMITLLHYDLVPSKRALALKNGAVEFDIKRYVTNKMRKT